MNFRRLLTLLALSASLSACTENDPDTQVEVIPEAELAAGFSPDPRVVTIYEAGNQGRVIIKLHKEPAGDVIIQASITDTSEFSLSETTATLNKSNWSSGYAFYLNPIDDGVRDGDQRVNLKFTAHSSVDPTWNTAKAISVEVNCIDNGTVKEIEQPPEVVDCNANPRPASCTTIPPEGLKLRFTTANATSGNHQNYNDGKGIRMLQALKPDIVTIQEFNYMDDKDEDIRSMIDTALGTDFYYHRGTGSIPNGIISRYPITSSGTWSSNAQTNRGWDWAVIDIPGDRDLLVVSVHLGTSTYSKELAPLHTNIQNKQAEGNYYVVLGGDFNVKDSRAGVRSNLGSKTAVFSVHSDEKDICAAGQFPVDQDGNSCTSAERDDPYDWLLFDKTLDTYEVPVTIGSHAYPYGHVLDSRVYDAHGELDDIAPVLNTDSWKYTDDPILNKGKINNFQHMPVTRDIVIPGVK